MSSIFELVIINSSAHRLFLIDETLITGTSDVHTKSSLINPKGVQRYKFKAGFRNVLEGSVTFYIQDSASLKNEFIVEFYHINDQWAAVEIPTTSCFKQFQHSYILDGTTFLNKKTLSMAVELSNIETKG